ncbi:hypothetical protein Gotri_018598 [Gossypium trilobum]|uniref:Uncharacterized protein n=1 Tax=Gossypium trilobum TaxID=34281 RepID=A0A7J9EAJ4_9ROSI|nr:hypothetical protein [Gossypium trilobum]
MQGGTMVLKACPLGNLNINQIIR